MPDDEPRFATYKAKWDEKYRKHWGIKNEHAGPLPNGTENRIRSTCKKAYKTLNLDGPVRFDLRLTPDNEIYILEANANPELAIQEDFAASAQKAGIPFDKLIEKLLADALNRYEL